MTSGPQIVLLSRAYPTRTDGYLAFLFSCSGHTSHDHHLPYFTPFLTATPERAVDHQLSLVSKWLCLGCVQSGVGKTRTVIREIWVSVDQSVLSGSWVIPYNGYPQILCTNAHPRTPLEVYGVGISGRWGVKICVFINLSRRFWHTARFRIPIGTSSFSRSLLSLGETLK